MNFMNLVRGAGAALLVALVSWGFSVGGFVTNETYAAHEDSTETQLSTIISMIKSQNTAAETTNKASAIMVRITGIENRIAEQQIYLDAEPRGPLAQARKNSVRNLQTLLEQSKRDLAHLPP